MKTVDLTHLKVNAVIAKYFSCFANSLVIISELHGKRDKSS